MANAFNRSFWWDDANIIDDTINMPQPDSASGDTIIMPQPERIGLPHAKERGRTIDSASGDPINMSQPERIGLPNAKERGRTIDSASGDPINMPQHERLELPPAKERGRTIDSASGDPINMPQPERLGLPIASDLIPQDNNSESKVVSLPRQEIFLSPEEEKYSIIPTIVSNAFNRSFWWDEGLAEDANIIDDPIRLPQPQPERIGIDAPPPAKERGSGDTLNLPQPERQGLPMPPEVKLFQEKMEAKQKQKSPIVEKKKSGEVGKTLLKTLGKGASFLLPYLIKAAAAGIDNLAALPKTALEGSMSPEQKALYGGGLAGAFANVSAAAPLPVTDRMREISDALLLHRMQQKYIDMLKKQADYMKTLDLNGHQLDYLGRQASGIAFMNNKAPGAINGIKR